MSNPAFKQRREAAAQHGLLPEEVRLGLLGEGRLDDAGPAAADAAGVGEDNVPRCPAGVVLHGEERGHALALDVEAPQHVARALGGDEPEVHLGRHDYLVEVDVEAVGEEHEHPLGEVRPDLGPEDRRLPLVRQEHHHHVGPVRTASAMVMTGRPSSSAFGRLFEPS